jgi:beta-N-acetylhexosaminidase
LTAEERQFFEAENPYGFILFRRNIDNPSQVRALVTELRDAVGRPDAPILIDQEGGRVARLGPPHWPKLPPARAIGILAETDLKAGIAAALASGRVIGAMLADLNIDVACAPVADLLLPETHDVIGDRAFAADPLLVAALARAMAQGLTDAVVTAIVKHIPGHGRAQADSHLSLPRIATPKAELAETDFAAFRALGDLPWAMVAHCIYADIDPVLPASISPRLIAQTIREDIGFKGILIADDIGMKALEGTLAANAAATLAAGCDLTLHCSGDLAEMKEIAPAVAPLRDDTLRRLKAASAPLTTEFDVAAERACLNALMRE